MIQFISRTVLLYRRAKNAASETAADTVDTGRNP